MDNSRIIGEFSTPENIISLVAELSKEIPASQILDPACGSATLLISAAQSKENAVLTGIDVNQGIVSKAENLLQSSGIKYRLLNADFFMVDLKGDFDLVLDFCKLLKRC
jgi:type I restriction-modification system DNA methylase subunit